MKYHQQVRGIGRTGPGEWIQVRNGRPFHNATNARCNSAGSGAYGAKGGRRWEIRKYEVYFVDRTRIPDDDELVT